MAQNKIGISGIGYDENLVTRVMTDKSSISLLRKLLKRMMVAGMTDDIISQKSYLWVKSKKGLYCANEQLDDVRNCDQVMTWF